MKKTVMPYIFSLIVLFSIIANTPIQSVKASEIDTNSTNCTAKVYLCL